MLYWHHQSSDRRKLARRRHSYRYWWMMEQHLRPHPKLSKSLLVVWRDFLFLLLIIDILDFLCYITIRSLCVITRFDKFPWQRRGFSCCGVIIFIIDIPDFLCYIFTRKVAQSPFGLSTGRTIKVTWVAFFLASHITFIKSIAPYCIICYTIHMRIP